MSEKFDQDIQKLVDDLDFYGADDRTTEAIMLALARMAQAERTEHAMTRELLAGAEKSAKDAQARNKLKPPAPEKP